ncbi:hypothetical protein PEDI_23090 [Persicobacter diffluens]|uniref:Uncharacterized protein n=1 Tax=Persicobacter diffluens TaxID=981 RepID=A0AAN4VZW0_9BACT|nr:hypothetical protein PEDI_23090 [Persicobacter diffluens]
MNPNYLLLNFFDSSYDVCRQALMGVVFIVPICESLLSPPSSAVLKKARNRKLYFPFTRPAAQKSI